MTPTPARKRTTKAQAPASPAVPAPKRTKKTLAPPARKRTEKSATPARKATAKAPAPARKRTPMAPAQSRSPQGSAGARLTRLPTTCSTMRRLGAPHDSLATTDVRWQFREGSGSVEDHAVVINADQFTPVSPELTPVSGAPDRHGRDLCTFHPCRTPPFPSQVPHPSPTSRW